MYNMMFMTTTKSFIFEIGIQNIHVVLYSIHLHNSFYLKLSFKMIIHYHTSSGHPPPRDQCFLELNLRSHVGKKLGYHRVPSSTMQHSYMDATNSSAHGHMLVRYVISL